MTTVLEQEFYKTFGIESTPIKSYGNWLIKGSIAENDKGEKVVYPEITAEKLLQMICINSYFCGVNFHHLWVKNPDEIKVIILDEIIRWYQQKKYGHEKCKHQIQQLFKEEE